jgi:hypothetical protein
MSCRCCLLADVVQVDITTRTGQRALTIQRVPERSMRFGRTLGASPGQRTTAGTDNESRAC